ncbi:MAG: hypothetical protein OSA95_07615 [Opitutales bacterium]|nr:hypothetical protein [Opitutales bacterium]
MKISRHLLLFCLLVPSVPLALVQAKIHKWTNKAGRTINAEFVKGDADTVTIFTNGRISIVKLSDLKPESQALARKLSATPPVDANSPASVQANIQTKGPLPTIHVAEADWGGASLRDIGKVLNSTAKQLWPHASQDRLDTIIVDRSRTGPIVLYRRGSEGQYLVRLDTHKNFWSQYAFQFAHEFGHILCGYKPGARDNLWFEESLCETASLFVMRRMREDWELNPPYSNWKSYAPALGEYAQKRLDQHAWPKLVSVSEWYNQNQKELRQNPTNRAKNTTIATKLLPLFEQRPENWGAVAYLNTHKKETSRDFSIYLADWKKACKLASQKEFVTMLARMFGVEQP